MSQNDSNAAAGEPVRQVPRYVQVWFAVPLLVLLAQGAVMRAGLGDPYPALLMPGFDGTRTDEDGRIRTTSLAIEVHFADPPHVEAITPAALFAPMPGSIISSAAANVLRHTPENPAALRPRAGVKGWAIETLTPGRAARGRRRAGGNVPTAETIAWARQRVTALFPNRRAETLVVSWYQDFHRLTGRRVASLGRERVDVYEVPLQ